MNRALHPAELEHIVDDSNARVVIVDHTAELPELPAEVTVLRTDPAFAQDSYENALSGAVELANVEDVDESDLAWLFYTSGTSGRPKGVMWTHGTLQLMLLSLLADVFTGLEADDVMLQAAPMTHGSGMMGLVAFVRGCTTVLAPPGSFRGEAALELVAARRVTHFAFVAPVQLARLAAAAAETATDWSSLRCIPYGGAPIGAVALRRAIEVFGSRLVQLYAQGECVTTTSYLSGPDHVRALTDEPLLLSAGRARTGVDVRAVDEAGTEVATGSIGELSVRGSIVMRGYWRNPEATRETVRDGWLHTGDLGSIDPDGYIYLLDRSKDVIVSGGMNVYPREVEDVLARIDEIEDVCVVGVPNAEWGEAVHAVVVLKSGRTLTDEAVRQACRQRLARFKCPKSVEFRSALPMNAYGKVLRRELRDEYWAEAGRRVGDGSVSMAPGAGPQ